MSDTKEIIYQLMPPADAMITPTTNKNENNEKIEMESEEAPDNPAPTTQESAPRRYPAQPHLQDRRNAKAAASDLRCTQQFLEEYRLSCVGRCRPDKRIQLSIMSGFDKAIGRFGKIANPGDRAARAFGSALRAMHQTLRLLLEEYERGRVARRHTQTDRHGRLIEVDPFTFRPTGVVVAGRKRC
jgi:hypothetical protein